MPESGGKIYTTWENGEVSNVIKKMVWLQNKRIRRDNTFLLTIEIIYKRKWGWQNRKAKFKEEIGFDIIKWTV